jgi:folate-binding protein YgfZ
MESTSIPGVRPGQASGTLLRIEGRDALELLHRISTQSLLELAPGQACATLFCDPRGRLLHRAWVALTGDRAVWLVRDDAPALPLVDFLERFIFREDVRLAVPREDRSVRLVRGSLGLEPGAVRERDGLPNEIQTRPDWGLELESPLAPGPAADLEHARILAGLPRHGHEIAESFTPFEVGLAHEVHLRKGCYTGQEALLRMMTYKSVRRRLVRVTGTGAPPAVPREIRLVGEVVGWITSAASEPGSRNEPGWTGLAVVKHEACEPNVELAEDGRAVTIAHAFEMLPPLGLS